MADDNTERESRSPGLRVALARLPRWKRTLLVGGAALTGAGYAFDGGLAQASLAGGLGVLGGFVGGRVLRAFVGRALATIAVVAAAAWGLSALGWLPEGWTLGDFMARLYDGVEAVTSGARDALLRVLPAGVLTGVGVFAGFRRDP